MNRQDFYTILGIGREATTDEIHQAFRELSRHYHPDINPSQEDSQRFSAITEAHAILRDESKRHAYDEQLRQSSPASYTPPSLSVMLRRIAIL